MMRAHTGLALLLAIGACGSGASDAADATFADATSTLTDGAASDASSADGTTTAVDGSTIDADPDAADASTTDAATPDAAAPDATPDAAAPDATPDAMTGVITGGPCISGATGATAYRVRWAGSGGTAYPVYEVNGLPDTSRDHIGAYGYQIGFVPSFVDTYLGDGGLQLNSSSFVDIELSTVGVSSITSASLSIYGRSYNTTTSGSFNWQTFSGLGSSPTNLVSNSAPYQWYSADMTSEIDPGDDGILIRIKAGPSSNSLAVNRIELCLVAD